MNSEQKLKRWQVATLVIGLVVIACIVLSYNFGRLELVLAVLPLSALVPILAGYCFVLARRQTRKEQQKEGAIEDKNVRLTTLVNSLGEAIFAVDKAGRITIYNSAALELLDSHEDLYGQPIDKVLHLLNGKNEPQSSIREVFERGRVILRDDLVLKTSTGQTYVYLTITPIKEKGELTGAIILARDISKQKGLEAQKDEFLSVVSHELRTPVAVVEADLSTVLLPGYAELPPKAAKLLRSASQNLTYLSGLLQDISDLSHSERTVLDTELVSFTAQKLATDLADDFANQATKTGQSIKLLAAEQPIELVSSYQRVREVLVNFLTNAIKYSGGKGKIITLRVSPSKIYPGGASFSVIDQGIGMQPTDLQKLFKKFFRASDQRVQQIRGTGMGLYIARRQADKIGAKIRVESQFGKGSSFSLEVPARIRPEGQTQEPSKPQ